MSLKSLFRYEGSILPLSGNLGCPMILAVIGNPIMGVSILMKNILPGIPLTTEIFYKPWYLAGALFCDPLILIFLLMGLVAAITGQDTVTRVIRGYRTSPTSHIIEYVTTEVSGSYAKLRGRQRLCLGLLVLGIKWIPLLVALYLIKPK
jgi:hypothetical protein